MPHGAVFGIRPGSPIVRAGGRWLIAARARVADKTPRGGRRGRHLCVSRRSHPRRVGRFGPAGENGSSRPPLHHRSHMSAPSPAALDATTGSQGSERRPYTFLVANAALIGAVTFVASWMLDRPVADPEGSFLGPSWVRLPVLCLTAIVLDLLPRALWQGRLDPARTVAAVRHRVRTHWTRARLQLVVVGISGFYVVYVAYRNLKSLLPLVRDMKYDSELRVLDRLLLLGHDPATLTQDLFGTGLSGARAVRGLPRLHPPRRDPGDRLAGLVAQHRPRLVVRHRAGDRVDPRHGVLLPAPDAGPGDHVPLADQRPAAQRHLRPDGLPRLLASRVPLGRGRLPGRRRASPACTPPSPCSGRSWRSTRSAAR